MLRHSDMHVHLDQFADPGGTADAAAAAHTALLAVTTTPAGFRAADGLLAGRSNVRVAAGLHPWWLDGRCGEDDVRALEGIIGTRRFIGEIGLDFLEKHAARSTWGRQKEVFGRICAAASAAAAERRSPTVLSIHAVRASETVLDILSETGCLKRCICILHWFSDSSENLWRAIRAGCWFSVGARSLATGKGREYIKLIPHDRLLFETDMPWPGDAERGYAAIHGSLAQAESAAAAIIGADAVQKAQENAAFILGETDA